MTSKHPEITVTLTGHDDQPRCLDLRPLTLRPKGSRLSV